MAKFRPGVSGNPRGSRPLKVESTHYDGWASAYTGFNQASRDKRLSHSYQGACLTYQEIAKLWEKDDITAKAIEAPTDEVFREGYEIEINDEGSYDDLAGEIEEKLEELCVDEALETAWQYMRAYGGSAILLGTKDNAPLDEPLDTSKPWALDYLNVFEAAEIFPVSNYESPGAGKYGEPEYFQLNNFANAGAMFVGKTGNVRLPTPNSTPIIHESRLIVFQGIKSSRYLPSSNQISQYWGSSVVERFIDQARDLDIGYSSAGIIATDISQPVITIQGLRDMVAKHEEKFKARMLALELGRSTARAILLDEKEKFERQTTNVAGIPEILDRLSIRTAAAIGIPLCVLLGYSPSSLGQPGEIELRLWHNTIRALQRRKFGPSIKRIAKMIMRTIRQRKLPKKWGVEWNELEHLNAMQMAEAKLNQSRVDAMDTKSGIIHPDEIRNSRYRNGYSFKTQIDTKKKAPGFMAPLPAGVVPGSTPGVGGAKPAGPNAHSVTSYARRNPAAPATVASPKAGGDVTPSNRDTMSELDYQRSMLERAHELGAEPGTIKFLEDLIALEESLESARENETWPDDETVTDEVVTVDESTDEK